MRKSQLLFAMLCGFSLNSVADGVIIDKIYDPYVQPLEKEVEFRALLQSGGNDALDDHQRYTIGYGQSLSDRWFAELYLVGGDTRDDSLDVDAQELEIKRQLTEQGEFSNDYGLLFELEKIADANTWEAKSTLIVLHEWQRWVGTLNASLIYEWGSGLNNEFETSLSAKMKYRYREALEPAFEMFLSQNTRALGPAALGTLRLSGARKLRWEMAFLVGLNEKTPEASLNINIEYEFR